MTNGNGNDFGSGDKYNEIEFKAEHPQKHLMNVNYKVHNLITELYHWSTNNFFYSYLFLVLIFKLFVN